MQRIRRQPQTSNLKLQLRLSCALSLAHLEKGISKKSCSDSTCDLSIERNVLGTVLFVIPDPLRSLDFQLLEGELCCNCAQVLFSAQPQALAADTVWVLPAEVSLLIHRIDTAVCAVFLIDFLVRLRRAPDKRAF
jgi:hypothetical protein